MLFSDDYYHREEDPMGTEFNFMKQKAGDSFETEVC